MNNTVHCTARTIFDRAKIDMAIKRLSVFCNDAAEEIIEELLAYESLSFIDLLIKTGMEQDELKEQLGKMVDSGLLTLRQHYYQPAYQLNVSKLCRVWQLACLLAR